MAIRLPRMPYNKRSSRQSLQTSETSSVPKGHIAVYVGESKKKPYVVPISYLNHPSFQALLSKVEEEFGFSHPMGGLTLPCSEDAFCGLACCLMGL